MQTTDDLDLIRSLLAEPGPSDAVVERGMSRLAALATAEAGGSGGSSPLASTAASTRRTGTGRLSRRPTHRRTLARWWVTAGTGMVAASAAAAVVVATLAPGTTARHPAGPASHPATALPPLRGARQILLTAASHVDAAAPSTGAYWHVAVVTGQVLPGGTKTHPFDVVTRGPSAKWYARVAGRREWAIGRPATTARPMTSADWTAWRAAGSPRDWRLGWIWRGHRYVPNDHGLSMTPAPVEKVWQRGDGVVGHIEGDQQGLTAAQFAALPSGVTRLRAYLFRLARRLARPGPVSSGGLPASYLVWDAGTSLLTDPVRPQVRTATFRVLAGLHGVHSLGLIRDPLNRIGYGLSSGPKVIVVDPATGTLLAFEYRKPIAAYRPGETLCKAHGSYEFIQGRWPATGPIGKNCTYYPGYYGRAYDGPSEYTAVVSAGWTSTLPPLPRATKANKASGSF